METGYDFILGTLWSRRFRSTEADWATNTLILKTKCRQTHRVPFIGTTATPRPDPPRPEPSVPTPPPSITVTSPRQFAHFIRQDDVTFFMVNVTDLLHYDPPCPDAELIPLEPDPPSISTAPISTSVRTPSVEFTPLSRVDADAEELARYTADLEPAVCDLIREYHDVFPSSFSYVGIPPMRDVEHSIQLVPDYRVHHQAPYRLSIPEASELKRQLEELLRLGFIKPSNSPWGAPVFFARKADETLRLCIDYRGLNRYTVKNSYPMPRSDELFDRLVGNRFFTKIDLRSGYHQIRVAAADQPKTAFRSRFGHYEFTVIPFGLTNAPATFQRAMNDIFRDILEQYVLVHLDDILVYSRTLEEHLRHLRDVLDRLRRHGFYAKLSNCRFAHHKVNFLRHYVSDQGLHMDDAKITIIAEWSAPTSAKQLRSFLGLSGDCPIAFYSRHLLPAEINYTADERQVLAVVYVARHWRHYLHGARFTVRTDNSVVQAFLTKPKLTPRQARWWRDLSEFSFTTENIKGETNRVADALSRRPDHDQEQIHLSSILVTTVHHSVIDEFRTQYHHCPDYRDIHATLRSGKIVPNYSLRDNGLVYWHGSQGTREPRICVPSTGQLHVRAVAKFHDQAVAGHMGFHKTLARVSRLYIWPKRKDFVKDYVAEYPTCQEVNSANHLPYGLLQPFPIPEGRRQSISMDFIGLLRPPTPRGHDAILVVVDRFTKRARFVPCRYAISAREVADIVFDRVCALASQHDLPCPSWHGEEEEVGWEASQQNDIAVCPTETTHVECGFLPRFASDENSRAAIAACSLLNLYNKEVLGDKYGKFPAPLLMTTMHFFMQFCCAALLLRRSALYGNDGEGKRDPELSWYDYLTKAVPAGVAASVDIGLSNMAIVSFPLSLHILVKSTGPVFVLIFGVILGLERPNLKLFVAVLVIFAGVGLTVTGGGPVRIVGLVMTVSSAALSGLRWVLTEIILKEKKLGKVEAMFYLSPVMAVFMGLFSLVLEPWAELGHTHFFDTSAHALQSMGIMTLGGLIALCMVGAELKLIQEMSALTMGIAGIVKDLFAVVGAVIILHDAPLRVRMVFGFFVAVCGVAYVNAIRLGGNAGRGKGLEEVNGEKAVEKGPGDTEFAMLLREESTDEEFEMIFRHGDVQHPGEVDRSQPGRA
ncbi:hypothetical protein CBR_g22972 [Chara braunii]|uniref:Reverse transcriptase domain-containing protein n=1 Tax=Chara braunii TaxID=69332 RepID=A0A388L381_CHABU|nr:hypothetical protein CBR_g22972 [Chara braunii]|eukprot:GBG76756.1 hypothetical protein CBR_g22972 [Chara braunii]